MGTIILIIIEMVLKGCEELAIKIFIKYWSSNFLTLGSTRLVLSTLNDIWIKKKIGISDAGTLSLTEI